ncbi:MAG: hypothetical protein RLZZ574_2864 [Cyanobacteriota bacterium]
MEVYIQKHPEQAVQLAINHLEDYLIVLNECRHLEEQIGLFGQSKAAKVSPDNFIDAQLTLAQQFRVEVVKRYLIQNPHKSQFWAMEYFKFFLHKSESYLEMFATGIDRIKSAIIDSLPHLDSNFRYSLSFQLHIVPGDMLDALITSNAENLPPETRRRKRITRQN